MSVTDDMVIGLDLGTSAIKVVAMDVDGSSLDNVSCSSS
jgi:sugar (pentulose or hexulose) kinase